LETLSPGGRGEGEGDYESEISHLKLAHMRRSLGTRKRVGLPDISLKLSEVSWIEKYRAEPR